MVNAERKVKSSNASVVRCLRLSALCALGFSLWAFLPGCGWNAAAMFKGPPPPPPPVESFVLRASDRLEPEKQPEQGTAEGDVAGAKELYRQNEFSKAEKVFHRVAENTHNQSQVCEEARFYEAECLRLQSNLPKAADTYVKMLNDFPSGAYREPAVQHCFEIANKWLDDTREEMVQSREVREGKRWMVWPHFVHLDKESPLLDKEGRAIEVLENVRYNDMNGPLADKALFLTGSVKFFNQDYKESGLLFTQLVETHPQSEYAQQAAKLAIISKQLSTGGSDYDGRKVAEARQLVQAVQMNYPELAAKEQEFLTRQLIGITLQQAEKDFKVADFYERTGKLSSAYFCFQVVRQRYPGTTFFDQATERMHALKARVEKDGKSIEGVPPVPQAARPGGPPEQAVERSLQRN